jgi:hypothetical protein
MRLFFAIGLQALEIAFDYDVTQDFETSRSTRSPWLFGQNY